MTGALQDHDTPACGTALAALRLIRVAGGDRVAFLQGQLTQDVRAVTPGRAARYAWADAQGRVLTTGELFDWQDALWLTVPAALAEATARRLRLFVLRARVTVDLPAVALAGRLAPFEAAVLPGGASLPAQPLDCAATADWCALRVDAGRLLLVAGPAILPGLLAGLTGPGADDAAWALADIRAGFVRPVANAGAFIPQMLNLDLTGAISFGKGCYSGQEIVTRTRHLGRVKRRTLRFGADAPLPAPGDPVFAPTGECGEVVAAAASRAGGEILAVVRLDAASSPLFADAGLSRALRPLPLPYPVPEAAPPA